MSRRPDYERHGTGALLLVGVVLLGAFLWGVGTAILKEPQAAAIIVGVAIVAGFIITRGPRA